MLDPMMCPLNISQLVKIILEVQII